MTSQYSCYRVEYPTVVLTSPWDIILKKISTYINENKFITSQSISLKIWMWGGDEEEILVLPHTLSSYSLLNI